MTDKKHLILFGGEEIPVQQAWAKLETANYALRVLERLNRKHASLATPLTREVEASVRKHLTEFAVLLPKVPSPHAHLEEVALALLQKYSPEDTTAALLRDYHVDCDLAGLVQLVGSDVYIQALIREGRLLRQNAVSAEQIAILWNEAKRPAPGKPFWDRFLVAEILGHDANAHE